MSLSNPVAPTGWTQAGDSLQRKFPTGSFRRGTQLINAIATLADAANHHPDIVLSYSSVVVALTTHDQGQVTTKDVTLAQEINQAWDNFNR